MATLLISDPEIAAGLPPFCPVRMDPTPPGAPVSDEVGQFVAQCPINFGRAVITQAGVQ